ncbi:MAG: phenylalanine--tRNA ligase beta subunit-related protein [archaeon]
MIEIEIEKEIFDRFPGVVIGVVFAKNLDNSGAFPKAQELIGAEIERIRKEFTNENLSQQKKIEIWRDAYRTFGGEPKKNKSSVENLYKRILGGNSLWKINKIVDVYNYISLKHMLPVGGEDLDKVKGTIRLAIAGESETPAIMLGESEARQPHKGEVIYKDDLSTICRRWNWKEADRTKLTEETRNCILVIEGLPPVGKEEIREALSELASIVSEACGGALETALLDSETPRAKG